MIVVRSMHSSHLSNSYLVADSDGGTAIIIDTGAPIEPLLDAVERHKLTVTHILNTHDHHDHTQHNIELQERFGAPVLDARDFADGQQMMFGQLRLVALDTPGHTSEHVSFLVNDEAVFSGDTLFRGSVGGTLDAGADGFDQLRHSIMDKLLTFDAAMKIYPGHSDMSTVGEELANNPIVRAWSGADSEGTTTVTVRGTAATAIAATTDYDGGSKVWVRFDDGQQAIVGGSAVSAREATV